MRNKVLPVPELRLRVHREKRRESRSLGIDSDPCQPNKEGSALQCNDCNSRLTAGHPRPACALTSPSAPTLCSCLQLLTPTPHWHQTWHFQHRILIPPLATVCT